MSMVLKKGFPDLDYHFQVGKVNGNSVMVSSAMTGTQNGELDLTSMGMGKIPPTGKSINVERTNSLGTVQGDKVVEIKLPDSGDGGLLGVFKSLGVRMPN
jgi:hypothetical protein